MKNRPVLHRHLAVLLGVAALSACARASEPIHGTDSSTHWLLTCTEDDECGEYSCQCGVCTDACSADEECSALPGAECASLEGCGLGSAASVCTIACREHSDCGEGFYCRNGGCAVDRFAGTVPTPVSAGDPSTPPGAPGPMPVEPTRAEANRPSQDTPASPPGPLGPTRGLDGLICDDEFSDPRTEPAGCTDGRIGFALPGTTDAVASREDHLAVRDALDPFLNTLDVSQTGSGVCCNGEFPGDSANCLQLTYVDCPSDLGELVSQFIAKRAELGLSDQALQLSIELPAPRHPRCIEGECGPEPYQGHDGAPPTVRTPVPKFFGPSNPSCSHDGECHIAGCGNWCLEWSEPVWPTTCDDPDPELADAFCGCVTGHCYWFD